MTDTEDALTVAKHIAAWFANRELAGGAAWDRLLVEAEEGEARAGEACCALLDLCGDRADLLALITAGPLKSLFRAHDDAARRFFSDKPRSPGGVVALMALHRYIRKVTAVHERMAIAGVWDQCAALLERTVAADRVAGMAELPPLPNVAAAAQDDGDLTDATSAAQVTEENLDQAISSMPLEAWRYLSGRLLGHPSSLQIDSLAWYLALLVERHEGFLQDRILAAIARGDLVGRLIVEHSLDDLSENLVSAVYNTLCSTASR